MISSSINTIVHYNKTIVILLSLALITSFNYKPNHRMGMSYSIETDKQTNCKLDFPPGLSYFLEAYGGYGENAEVAQVSKILTIDLNCFQNTYNGSEYEFYLDQKKDGVIKDADNAYTEFEKNTWQPIDSIGKKLEEFISKINSQPDFHKKIRYSKLKREEVNLNNTKIDDKFMQTYLEEYIKTLGMDISQYNQQADSSKKGKRLKSTARSGNQGMTEADKILVDSLNKKVVEKLMPGLMENLNDPELQYPYQNNYCSGGMLKKDLEKLLDVVECIKKSGCKKMRFNYY